MISPAPDLPHQDVAGETYFQTRQALAGKSYRAFIAPVDVRLPKAQEADDSIDTAVQPDVLVRVLLLYFWVLLYVYAVT
ncbi:hypothetical protein [Methylomonas sp. 11b]|uniref:hypothetical protein n=1 Tax=Methylomonas sp. 11b TaxID=1168169 RepID=UPI00047B9595|nr:hypothetical protein [Methylomonas sp. 11b]